MIPKFYKTLFFIDKAVDIQNSPFTSWSINKKKKRGYLQCHFIFFANFLKTI